VVLGISGSLRAGSFKRLLLVAAQELAPAGMRIEIGSFADVPLYSEDVDVAGDPPAVTRWKAAIDAADALLIATPEYNHAIPGGLKNALDWASRPPRGSVLDLKPVAVTGATVGIGGTAQAQADVRRSLNFPGAQTMPEPELYVARARTKFDGDRLVDGETRDGLRALLEALAAWTREIERLVHAAAA
jgi:chromate reductase, NAD(P)H dehydrogenase (quinone)